MKKKIVMLLVLAVTIIFVGANLPVSADAVTQDGKQATIETDATSQLDVAPDIAYINANINIVDESKDVAYNTNKNNTSAMVNAIISAGVNKTDIKTTSFYASSYIDRVVVDPKADNPTYKDVKKYQTSSNFKITVNDISKVSDILDKMLGVDNININNITYGVKNISKYKKDAIKQAVDTAKENITYAADAAEVKLDKLQTMTVDFSNNSSSPQPFYAKALAASDSTPMYQNPENIKITASVHLVYTTK